MVIELMEKKKVRPLHLQQGEREMDEENEAASILVLPEDCLSEILSRTSPGDACRAAAISHGFKSTADSDTVWERFLPPDYHEVIERAVSPVVFSSKKQLYVNLPESYILLDRGNLSIMLDKWSGKKRCMLGARELSIAWQDDTRYWEWGHIPESGFPEVGILREVCWLHIQGKLASVMLSQKTRYAAYLVFRIPTDSGGLDVSAKTMVSFAGTRIKTSNVYLQTPLYPPRHAPMLPCERKDRWQEIKLGEFYLDEGDDGEVEMGFEEVSHLHWKHGLIVKGMELRPK